MSGSDPKHPRPEAPAIPSTTPASLLTTLGLLTALGIGCDKDASDGTGLNDPGLPTVIVLVLDGVRLEDSLGEDVSSATGELPEATMPTVWDELVPYGLRSTETWNVGATTTAPAHAALLTGRREVYANFAMGSRAGLYQPTIPTLHEQLEASGAVALGGTYLYANTGLLEGLASSLWPWDNETNGATYILAEDDDNTTQGERLESDVAVLKRLMQKMKKRAVELAVLNLHKVDLAGHYGENTDYADAVANLDEPVADLWAWIQADPRYAEDTWLVVVSDHGRNSIADTTPVWRHHGCQCNGCRRVPFLLLGPGVRAAHDGDAPILLTDVAPTVAALLGQPMPWADGLVRDDLLEQPTQIPSRSGLADIATAGGLRAELRYTDDPARRKELWVEGSRLSSEDAVEVEAPVMAASDDATWLCFREIALDATTPYSQWAARCLVTTDDGISWDDIGAPIDPVGPWWQPALLPVADGLLATYAYNPNGLASLGSIDGQGSFWIEAALWDGSGWTASEADTIPTFPTAATAVGTSRGEVLVAVGGSTESDKNARHSRGVYSGVVTHQDGTPTWQGMFGSRWEELTENTSTWRLEHPALGLDEEGNPHLAAVAYTGKGTLAVVASNERGARWRTYSTLELGLSPLPNLGPTWFAGRPVWAVRDRQTGWVSVCAALPDEEPACAETGSERVLRMVAEGDETLLVIADASEGEWELREISASELTPTQ